MKHTTSTQLKFVKVLKKIHNLKVKKINDNVMFSALHDIYSDIELIFDIYQNQKLTDKEQAVIVAIKKEKVAEKVRKSYRKKLYVKEMQMDNIMSAKDRKSFGYMKHLFKIKKSKETQTKLEEVLDIE
jgi:CRISPR/Cas system CMR-associated protein Cmr3 (group 5 of RAMP superfamily)